MSNKTDIDENDGEPIDRGRRGLLVRFGLVAAAVPVLMALSPASYARGDDGGGKDGGHDGGHDGAGSGGDRGEGGDDHGVAGRGDDDAPGHDGGDLDFDLRKTGANNDDFTLDPDDERASKSDD